eukprot:gnl/MRDRNA2_/MRDRNA2_141071_c0_seq1.p1 gnl/MRDRNA2_/MRDRNA2_141071_c0~~gnl/MRDRNA2_/MRDRNA2_141071_c0_seq1.p1  ORF type:complete len:648 (-),score=125.97 gnl/MRDRNA2_/MRDRNA2_141071_c0_seq1:81-1958(-)
MAGSRARPPSAPAGLQRKQPQTVQANKVTKFDKGIAEEWFQPNVPDPSATGQLGAYTRAPVQKGMCNPPRNERVRQDLLEYLFQNGIETEVCKSHLSTLSLPDGIKRRPMSAGPTASNASATKSGVRQVRPKSANAPKGIIKVAHAGHEVKRSVQYGASKKHVAKDNDDILFRQFATPWTSRNEDPASTADADSHALRPSSPFKNSSRHPPNMEAKSFDRPLSAELQNRRERRIEEGNGDLRNQFRPLLRNSGLIHLAAKKRSRAASAGSFGSKRSGKDSASAGLLDKFNGDFLVQEATQELKVQSRTHHYVTSNLSTNDLGELNIFHNSAMRDIHPSKIRTGTKWEDAKFSTPGSREGSPDGRKRNRGPGPWPWKRDKSTQLLLSLQAKVGQVQSASSGAVNWQMKRDALSRGDGRGCDSQLVSQFISKMMVSGGDATDIPNVQRYTPAEMSRMQNEREYSACQMLGDKPKKKIIGDAFKDDMSGLLDGIVRRSQHHINVQGEAPTAAALARNQEIQSLSKKYVLQIEVVEALWFKFDQLDESREGFLNPVEFKKLLKWIFKDGGQVTDQAANKLWNELDGSVDKVKDGGINFEEFLVWFVRKVPNFSSLTPTQLKSYISNLGK